MAGGIYKVRTDGVPDRYVEAKSRTAAFVHVASEYFKVDILSNSELREAVKAGVKVEVAGEVKAEGEPSNG